MQDINRRDFISLGLAAAVTVGAKLALPDTVTATSLTKSSGESKTIITPDSPLFKTRMTRSNFIRSYLGLDRLGVQQAEEPTDEDIVAQNTPDGETRQIPNVPTVPASPSPIAQSVPRPIISISNTPQPDYTTTNTYDKRPHFFKDGLVNATFDTNEGVFPIKSEYSKTWGLEDGRFFMEKRGTVQRLESEYEGGLYNDFNCSVDVQMPDAPVNAYIGLRLTDGNSNFLYIYRPNGDELYFYLERTASDWDKRFSTNLEVNNKERYGYDRSKPLRLGITSLDREIQVYVNEKRRYPGTQYAPVIKASELGPARISLAMYGPPNNNLTGFFDNFSLEGKAHKS